MKPLPGARRAAVWALLSALLLFCAAHAAPQSGKTKSASSKSSAPVTSGGYVIQDSTVTFGERWEATLVPDDSQVLKDGKNVNEELRGVGESRPGDMTPTAPAVKSAEQLHKEAEEARAKRELLREQELKSESRAKQSASADRARMSKAARKQAAKENAPQGPKPDPNLKALSQLVASADKEKKQQNSEAIAKTSMAQHVKQKKAEEAVAKQNDAAARQKQQTAEQNSKLKVAQEQRDKKEKAWALEDAKRKRQKQEQARKFEAKAGPLHIRTPVDHVLPVKLEKGLKQFLDGFAPVRQWRSGKLCAMSGLLITGPKAQIVTSVADRCKPANGSHAFDLHSGAGKTTRTDVIADGTVKMIMDPAHRWLSLNGLLYPGLNAPTVPIELRNGWSNFANGYAPAMYTIDGDLCVLSGVVQNSKDWKSNDEIAKLPSECRPEGGRLVFHVNSNENTQQVDVLLDGIVQWIGGQRSPSINWLSLDGVFFTRTMDKAIDLLPAMSKAPTGQAFAPRSGYRPPSAKLDGSLCFLSGSATWQSDGKSKRMFMLPDNCRPLWRTVFAVWQGKSILRVDVKDSGEVSVEKGDVKAEFVSLDGIFFMADKFLPVQLRDREIQQKQQIAAAVGKKQAELKAVAEKKAALKKLGQNLPLTNGARLFGHLEAKPQYGKLGRLCLLSGVMDITQWQSSRPYTTLPPQCRPAGGVHVFNLHGERGHAVRFDVTTAGEVYYKGGAKGRWVSLDGMAFVAGRGDRVELSLQGDWTAVGGEMDQPSFTVVQDVCVVSGRIRLKSGKLETWTNRLAVLPEECRPEDGRLAFSTMQTATTQRVDVTTDGQLWWVAGTRTAPDLSLDGVLFYRKKLGSRKLAFHPGFRAFGANYRAPSYKRQGDVCFVSGMVEGHVHPNRRRIADLPDNCRPHSTLRVGVNHHGGGLVLRVSASGLISYHSGAKTQHFFSLDGIHFHVNSTVKDTPAQIEAQKKELEREHKEAKERAAKHRQDMQPRKEGEFELSANTRAFGFGYGKPTQQRSGAFCMLEGLLVSKDYSSSPLRLDPMCVPRDRLVLPAAISGARTAQLDVLFYQMRAVKLLHLPPKYDSWLSLDSIVYPRKEAPRTVLTLTNSFRNHGGANAPAVMHAQDGVCLLSGRVKFVGGKNASTVITHVPPRCRPEDGVLSFQVYGSKQAQRVDVRPNGKVVWRSRDADQQDVSLDGIMYVPSLALSRELQLLPGYTAFSKLHREPRVSVVNGVCLLSGKLKGNFTLNGASLAFAVLDERCRPDSRRIFHLPFRHGSARVDVTTEGRLLLVSAPPQLKFLSLESIRFVTHRPKVVKPPSSSVAKNSLVRPLGQMGGLESSNNLARKALTVLSSSVRSGYKEEGVNDGLYGNNNAFAPNPNQPLRGMHFVGLVWGEPVTIRSVAWGRDNTGKLSDSYQGQYIVQYTNAQEVTGNSPDSSWINIGSVRLLDTTATALKNVFNLQTPVTARALRLILPDGTTVVDELEVYSYAFNVMEMTREGGALVANSDRALAKHGTSVAGSAPGEVGKLIDGRYGSASAWAPQQALRSGDMFTATLTFPKSTRVHAVAFSRDNTGKNKGNALGRYVFQVDVGGNQWRTIGSALIDGSVGKPHLRHVFRFSQTFYSKQLRFVIFGNQVVDELEVYDDIAVK